jgi:hypothetical protein
VPTLSSEMFGTDNRVCESAVMFIGSVMESCIECCVSVPLLLTLHFAARH